MARKASVVEETPLPTEEVTPSDAVTVEEAKPPEEGVTETPPKETEKPDFAAQIAELPEDERKALLKEHLGEDLNRFEQSATDRAWSKLQAEQQGRVHRERRSRPDDGFSSETRIAGRQAERAAGPTQRPGPAQARELSGPRRRSGRLQSPNGTVDPALAPRGG